MESIRSQEANELPNHPETPPTIPTSYHVRTALMGASVEEVTQPQFTSKQKGAGGARGRVRVGESN